MKAFSIIILVILVLGYIFIHKLRSRPQGKLNLAEALFLKYLFKPINRLEVSLQKQRQQYLDLVKKFPEPHIFLHDVSDRSIPGPVGDIPIRIYKPSAGDNLPILVYFHGGGWVIGNLDTHDSVCRKLCKDAQVMVVAVDYRLSPEHKFPVPLDDCYAALQWVADNASSIGGDADRIAVGGDSAGGNLATVVSIKARDENGPSIKYQLLIYPVTDGSRDAQSKIDFASGYLLTKRDMDYFGDCYINEASDYLNPRISPLLASDLSGLPPAFLLTAGFDPLRDEGKAYAEKMKNAGVLVDYKNYEGTIHAFFGISKFKQSNVAMKDCADRLKANL